MNQKIYIVGFWPDYEKYFFSDIDIQGFDILTINPMEIREKNPLFKYIPRFIRNQSYKKLVHHLIRKEPEAIYIFQEFRLLNEFLIETNLKFKANILFRNPVTSNPKTLSHIKQLKAKNMTAWTFDKEDADRYHLKYYNQLMRKFPSISQTPIHYDFSFVGRDKGREEGLLALQKNLSSKNLSMKIDIIGSHKKDSISYKTYLKKLCHATCIVDIVQNEQSGITLRPLEALVYKRKLLTNNKAIKNTPIYHPDNIYLLNDNNDLDDIVTFMSKPFTKLPSEVAQGYSAKQLLKQIIDNC